MLKSQSFHPKIIIAHHFDEMKYQIDINTETILEKSSEQALTNDEINGLNKLREKQIEKLNEIESIGLNMVIFDEDEYKCRWAHVIDDKSLDYGRKIDLIKEALILTDCILLEDSELNSKKSLWITPFYLNNNNANFLR